ncbi:MAG: spore maturation protein [Gammaproteobacteria bacterium]|nr:MAG: spore maturation protein [Gammaproteobacteria bacterium]
MMNLASILVLPLLLVAIPFYGLIRRVPVYEEFVLGAREGFEIAVRIIPFLIAILFAIGMFRASGALDAMLNLLGPGLTAIGVPPDLLPIAVMRPLSGSGSLGLLADLVNQHGADSLVVKMAGTLFGSTETTFYVLAVYFGAVGIRRTRYAVHVGLIADASAAITAVIVSHLLFT